VPSPGNSVGIPPRDHEVEVSVFGPGFGESIAIHVGLGDWIVIDSCKSVGSKLSAPLVYLNSLGVDVSARVHLVIASHWHDDHIRGLTELFVAAKKARLVCPAAIRIEEFSHILNLAEEGSETLQRLGVKQMYESGVAEISGLIRELSVRTAGTKPMYALGMRELWNRAGQVPVIVRSLSPSDGEFQLAQQRFAALALELQDVVSRIPSLEPNDTSVVVSVIVQNDIGILLGSDLENRTIPESGWDCVLENWNNQTERHKVFKVSHHGSDNGHHDCVWTDMLGAEPIAVLTPFRKGRVNLPTSSNRTRLQKLSKQVFLTSLDRSRRFRLLDRTAQKTMEEHTAYLGRNPPYQRHVRLRTDLTTPDTWKVELFGDAIRL
jgi:beta-lactamase superfamily II metal-dependent hydrolase